MPAPRDPRRRKKETPKLRTPWFWWCVTIALAICFAVSSWIGVDYLFAFPEREKNFTLLQKIGRLPEIPDLKGPDAPEGLGLRPIPIYSQFSVLPDELKDEMNKVLRRQFISGFIKSELTYYVEGEYKVLRIRDLTPEDFVTEGFAILCQATIRPDEFRPAVRYPVYLEYILPSAKPTQKTFYPKGSVLTLQKVPAFCSIAHVARFLSDGEPVVVISAIPITAGTQKTPDGQNIRTRLPGQFNIAGTFPLFDYSEELP